MINSLRPLAGAAMLVSVMLASSAAAPAAAQQTAAAVAPKAYIGLFKDNAVAVLDTSTSSLRMAAGSTPAATVIRWSR